MRFQLAVNLERTNDTADMRAGRDHTLEMVQMAEEGGSQLRVILVPPEHDRESGAGLFQAVRQLCPDRPCKIKAADIVGKIIVAPVLKALAPA